MTSSACTDCVALLVAQSNPPASSLVEKVLLVVLGVVLGFLSSYVLDRLKAKREPRHQVSWDVSIERALIEVNQGIKSKVRFTYNGIDVQGLNHVRCTVVNTGNRVVKDLDLRFPFPKDGGLLEHYLDPRPEPEFGVEFVAKEVLDGADQCKYRIGHLERDEEVSFNFVTTGDEWDDWKPWSRTKDGDVEFQRRDVVKVKEDQEHLQPFLVLVLLGVALPPALSLLDFGVFGDLGVLAVRLVLLGALLPHIRPLVRIVNGLIAKRLLPKHAGGTQNHASDISDGPVIQVGTIQGNLVFRQRRPEDKQADGQNGLVPEVTIT